MVLCSGQEMLLENSVTMVENVFIVQYMPDAPAHAVEVYLMGLYLASSGNEDLNNIEAVKRRLNLSEDDIVEAFAYWEQLGLLVVVSVNPLHVRYLPIKNASLHKKIRPQKYGEFNKQIQGALSGRMITPTEFTDYYLFLEESGFEPNALVRVAKYCAELKGEEINYRYILTVARNLAKANLKTFELVDEKLGSHSAFSEDIYAILKILKLKRNIDFNDRRSYEKWTQEWGFSFDTIIHVAKTVKRGGLEKLDRLLDEFYKANVMSVKEIDAYTDNKTALTECAWSLNRIIGVYYQNVDFIVEEYVVKWTSMGFDRQTLELIARYCFKQNIRTLEGLDSTVERFYKRGLTTVEGINQMLESLILEDENIKNVLSRLGLVRGITQYDRRAYRVWTQEWGFEHDSVMHAAGGARSDYNPMAYLNRLLSQYRQEGIRSVSDMESRKPALANTSEAIKKTQKEHERDYTREELNALFDVLGDL